jgi:hypothetical protein
MPLTVIPAKTLPSACRRARTHLSLARPRHLPITNRKSPITNWEPEAWHLVPDAYFPTLEHDKHRHPTPELSLKHGTWYLTPTS